MKGGLQYFSSSRALDLEDVPKIAEEDEAMKVPPCIPEIDPDILRHLSLVVSLSVYLCC